MTTPAQFIEISGVRYAGDIVQITVTPCATLANGSVMRAGAEYVGTTQTDLNTLAVANGAPENRWGDPEIDAKLRAQQMVVTPAVDPIPEVPAVLAEDGTVVTPAVPAVAGIDAVYASTYGDQPIVHV